MSGPLAGADDLVVRLRKVEGQLRGLQQLAATGENLDELLTQLRAARGALHAVAVAAVTAHLSAPGVAASTDPGVLRHYLELLSR